MHNMIRNMCINKAHVIFAAAGLAHLSAGDVNGRYDVLPHERWSPRCFRPSSEPTRFLLMFSSTRAAVLLFNTCTHNRPMLNGFRIHLYVHEDFCLSKLRSQPVGPLWRLVLVRLLHTRWDFPSAVDPVDSGWFFIGAVVPADG